MVPIIFLLAFPRPVCYLTLLLAAIGLILVVILLVFLPSIASPLLMTTTSSLIATSIAHALTATPTTVLSVAECLPGSRKVVPSLIELLLEPLDLSQGLIQLRVDLGDDRAPALLQLLLLGLNLEELIFKLRARGLQEGALGLRFVQQTLELRFLTLKRANLRLVG